MPAAADAGRRFWRVSTAGIFFQGGGAAVDTSTVVASLLGGLTGGSAFAVGAAAALTRFDWLFPQLFVAYHAQRHARRPFYVAGAFGRVVCLAGLAGLLWLAPAPTGTSTVVMFFALWTVYAFVSSLVAACCTDLECGRACPSPIRGQAIRTEIGRPSSSMRLSTWTATATSVARRSSLRDRSPSPITCFHRAMAASTRARVL